MWVFSFDAIQQVPVLFTWHIIQGKISRTLEPGKVKLKWGIEMGLERYTPLWLSTIFLQVFMKVNCVPLVWTWWMNYKMLWLIPCSGILVVYMMSMVILMLQHCALNWFAVSDLFEVWLSDLIWDWDSCLKWLHLSSLRLTELPTLLNSFHFVQTILIPCL